VLLVGYLLGVVNVDHLADSTEKRAHAKQIWTYPYAIYGSTLQDLEGFGSRH
jgi:hypothetical protein